MTQSSKKHHFIEHLESLKENRAALAALRQGLGQSARSQSTVYRYVIPHLPKSAHSGNWEEQSYYLLAGLYALHPKSSNHGNLGDHFSSTLDTNNESGNEAIERRFSVLLEAHPDELSFYLRQAIRYLRSKDEIPINWNQLMWDIRDWEKEEHRIEVQRRWANRFWRRPAKSENNTN